MATASTNPPRRTVRPAATAVVTLWLIRTASSTVSTVLVTRTADTAAAGAAVRETIHNGMISVRTTEWSEITAAAPLAARNRTSRSARAGEPVLGGDARGTGGKRNRRSAEI